MCIDAYYCSALMQICQQKSINNSGFSYLINIFVILSSYENAHLILSGLYILSYHIYFAIRQSILNTFICVCGHI